MTNETNTYFAEKKAALEEIRLAGKKFDAVVTELDALKKEKDRRVRRDGAIELSIRTMRRSKQVLMEWDNTIWTIMIEKAVVHRDKTITFNFRNGSEITVGA